MTWAKPEFLPRIELGGEAASPGRSKVLSLASEISLVIFDFDGVLTDNHVFVTEAGEELVRCSRFDGFGVSRLFRSGVDSFVLSTEQNRVVSARCRKLKLPCFQGIENKESFLLQKLEEKGIAPSRVAYLGNDINDIGCFKIVGLPIAVRDAHPSVFEFCSARTRTRGGHGAVREVCDFIVNAAELMKTPR